MSTSYQQIHQNILTWYTSHGRVTLPWRNTSSPYEIYLSEIMLQQTQVKTVLERFYFPFLKKFPTFKDVANAPVDDVLKAWEGLGYYTRARNLHKTAQMTQGELPTSAEELEKLSGIGRSTAHAVACFAFDEALPILDANVKRILYRFFAVEKCSDKELWSYAYKLFDDKRAYDYNQAMMDIGSQICLHKKPQCSVCPFESQCLGKDEPLLYPTKKVKKKKPVRAKNILIQSSENKIAIFQNRDKKLLHGLWGFEQFDAELKEEDWNHIGEISHHYTHFHLQAKVYWVDAGVLDLEFYSLDEIAELALSTADKKVIKLFTSRIN